MPGRAGDRSQGTTLGPYLAAVRAGKSLTLRGVEEATGKEVSNAYLSQLENGKVSKPSPNVLHALARVYGISYETLMEKAGYISRAEVKQDGSKHGRAATFAVENLTEGEEHELLRYLAWMRSQKDKR